MKPYTYLLINIACISIPLLASFWPKKSFYKEWKYFIPANLIVGLLFIIWDIYFTKIGVWGFNEDYLIGVNIVNLPLEEALFFICIPYACVFTYFALKHLIKTNPLQNIQKQITIVLVAILLVFTVFNLDKWYTAITFVLTSLFLLYLLYIKENISYYYLSYIFIYPFFLISNGILTGSFIKEPIVWYNNQENIDYRIGTIPVEDSIYGLLLIFLNIKIYMYLKSKWQKEQL
jgi:lycopene cyclase domain-containing protein